MQGGKQKFSTFLKSDLKTQVLSLAANTARGSNWLPLLISEDVPAKYQHLLDPVCPSVVSPVKMEFCEKSEQPSPQLSRTARSSLRRPFCFAVYQRYLVCISPFVPPSSRETAP